MRVQAGQQSFGNPAFSYTNYPGYNAGLPYGAANFEYRPWMAPWGWYGGWGNLALGMSWPWWNYGWRRPAWLGAGYPWWPPVAPYTWFSPRYSYVYASGPRQPKVGCAECISKGWAG